MGVKERRERERQEARQAILSAAREIARRDGWTAVTIRALADRIEYSQPVIYGHFASKDSILFELAREGYRILVQMARLARDSAAEPVDAFLALIDAYWQFAWDHPELYQVMYGLGGVKFECASAPPEFFEFVEVAQEALLAAAATRGREVPDPAAVSDILWCTVHGLISLTMVDLIPGGRERAASHLVRATRALFEALVAQVS